MPTECRRTGDRIPDPNRCDGFIVCSTGGRKEKMVCPKAPANSPLSRGHDRLRFNSQLMVCDWPGNVVCESDRKPTTTKKPVTIGTPKTKIDIPKKQKVCFESKGDKPGSFKVRSGESITQLKISHQRGRVTCDTTTDDTNSRFGCSKHFLGYVGIVVADKNRKIVFPRKKELNKWGFYKLKAPSGQFYTGNDKRVIINFDTPFKVGQQTELFLWYGEDFLNVEEAGNNGRVCTRVEVNYQ